MDGSGVREIANMAEVKIHEVNGSQYSTDGLQLIRPLKDGSPSCIELTTLQGIVDLINSDAEIADSQLLLHICGPGEIKLRGCLRDSDKRRFLFAMAEPIISMQGSIFDRWVTQEDMSLLLQSYFEDSGDRKELLDTVASVVDGMSATFADDGTAQEITVNTGVKAKVKMPNPVTLAPYRTFPEIDQQPLSKFVFRIKSGASSGSEPHFKLISADGGKWQLEAVGKIRDWFLGVGLPENVKIIA